MCMCACVCACFWSSSNESQENFLFFFKEVWAQEIIIQLPAPACGDFLLHFTPTDEVEFEGESGLFSLLRVTFFSHGLKTPFPFIDGVEHF